MNDGNEQNVVDILSVLRLFDSVQLFLGAENEFRHMAVLGDAANFRMLAKLVF